MTGRFVTFEGGEGAGKSTQARLLADALAARGIGCDLTREPGGTPGAEAIRDLILHPPAPGWTAAAEALLFAAARADHVARRIRPALADGRWVICDRFLDSSRAYQGFAGGLGDAAIADLHRFGSGGLLPDLTLVIVAGAHETQARLARRDGSASDAIGGRDAAYHARVNAAFMDLAEQEPDRFRLIDGTGTPDEVQARVWAAVASLLPC